MKKFGPCKIIQKFDYENAYEVVIERHWHFTNFNVIDLYKFHGTWTKEDDTKVSFQEQLPPEQVEQILDNRTRRNT